MKLASRFANPKDLNAGLQDQTVALEFIQQNVGKFGGDSNKVCICIYTRRYMLTNVMVVLA